MSSTPRRGNTPRRVMSFEPETKEPCVLCGKPPPGLYTRWPGGACLSCTTTATTGTVWRSKEKPPRFLVRSTSTVGDPEHAHLSVYMLVRDTYTRMDALPAWNAAWRELAIATLHTIKEAHLWQEPIEDETAPKR